MTKPILGIIAGGGQLPLEIAKIYSRNGGKCVIAALEPENHFSLSDIYECRHFHIGQAGEIIKYFHEQHVQDIILVGNVERPELKTLKVDFKGSKLIARIMKNKIIGDDNALKTVCAFLEEQGFKVISPVEILKLTDYDSALVAVNCPNSRDERDIEVGAEILTSMGNLDVGQSVIVHEGYVLGIEAAEGTDNLIRRCEILRKTRKGGVLIKMSKQAQDMRLDVPTIGPDTIFFLAKHGFNGVAIERKKVIIVNPEETKKLASESNIFISLI